MRRKDVKALVCILVVALHLAMPVCAANRLTNGSFEKWEDGAPAGWHWFKKHGRPPQPDNPTPVGIDMAQDEAYAGNRSIHFWKSSVTQGDRYGMLYQDVKNLPPGAKLRFRAMLKGKGVGDVMFGIWSSRPQGPAGDYDWREVSGVIEVPKGDTEIRFMVLVIGSKTDSLWLDEIALVVEGEDFPPVTPSEKARQGRVIETSYNYVFNGSFETMNHYWYRDPFDPWQYQPRDDEYKLVAFTRDAGISTHGFYSIRISKTEGKPPATLDQKITGLTPGTTIRYGVMLKGKGVKGASISLGNTHSALPDGDFDWRLFTGKTELAADQSECTLSVRVTGVAEGLWVDQARVWPDGKVSDQGGEHLLIRRVHPSARPGVQTIARMKPYPEKNWGFEVIVRNPSSEARTFTLNWTLCDVFGAPMKSASVPVKLDSLQQKRIMIPLTSVIRERRTIGLIATLRDDLGRVLADDLDYVTSLPESLAPIIASKRFGYNLTPYLWSSETIALYMDLAAAGGCSGFKYNHMARSYNVAAEKLDLDAYKWLFSMAKKRGIEVLPILYYTPVWATSAPPDATRQMKICSMPLLEPWRELCKQYVREHKFKVVEVWNEPNGGFWASFPKDKTYAQLLTATYEAVKEVDPTITVLGCSTNNSEINWPESVLKAGGKMDAISFHPYRWPQDSARGPSIEKPLGENPTYREAIEQMNAMSAKYTGGKPLPLYVTEVGTHEVVGSGKQHSKRLHGMALYKSQYHIRTYLTLAGLGVVRTYIFQFGDAVAKEMFGAGIHKDLSLKPAWWATRTLHEIAAAREIGAFTELSDDVFSLTMTGYRNAVAVWTAEDPAIVGTTKTVREARDLFGRPIEPIAAPQGTAYVIPAGSVIYLMGDTTGLTSQHIQPLVRFAADTWRVPPGGKVNYSVETTAAAAAYFPDGLPKQCSLTFDDPSMVHWASGEMIFSAGEQRIRVPAMVPVRKELGLKLRFNEQCHPEIWIENNLPEAVDAVIEIRAGEKVVQAKTIISTSSIHKEVVPVLPQDPAKPLDVEADVTLAGKQFNISKSLYYASVPKRTIEIDGEVEDWSTVKRIEISQWHKWHNFGVDAGGSKDFSASMSLAHDDTNFYVLAEVTDDVHSEPEPPGQSWRGDSVQVAFDPYPMGDHAPIGIDIALTDDGQETIFSRPMNAIDETQVQFKIRRLGTQTIYEMAVPLSALRVEGGRGTRLGFSFLVNENDSGAREGYLHWSDGIGMGTDPEKYGQLIFGK